MLYISVAQEEGANYLAACDIFLSPHIPNPDGTKFFGSPTKLFEYMGMGKAIIASDLDQIGEVLEHNKTAYLVPPGDVEALANAIAVVANDETLRIKLGENARKEVVAKYTWERHVERIFEQLNNIVEDLAYD
jgi:glycosyltransferase involved in cell wall biosynthesis